MNIESPYNQSDIWIRGNIHTHTTISDGNRSPEAVIDDYESRGYDFLAISDHDIMVDPRDYQNDTSMTLIPAVEITDNGPHLQHIGATETISPVSDRRVVIDSIDQSEGFAILNHPNWKSDFDHWPVSLMRDLIDYSGIEIYNGITERKQGSAVATDKWDQLLTAGRRVWGIGSDDSHAIQDVGRAWMVIQVDEPKPTPESIMTALSEGRSYVSTGGVIESCSVLNGSIEIKTRDADQIRLISDSGRIQRRVEGTHAQFELPSDLRYGSDHTYVRVECLGKGGTTAWTQPFFIE